MISNYKQLTKNVEKAMDLKSPAAVSDLARTKESTEVQIKLQGLQDFYRMRRNWGAFLMGSLGVILLFNISLVFLVGMERLKYSDEWFLRVVLTTNLADIIGLVYLVVKFLFSHPETNPVINSEIRS